MKREALWEVVAIFFIRLLTWLMVLSVITMFGLAISGTAVYIGHALPEDAFGTWSGTPNILSLILIYALFLASFVPVVFLVKRERR